MEMAGKSSFEQYGFEALPYKHEAYELDSGRHLYRVKKYGEMWMLTIFARSGGYLNQMGPRHVFYQAEHAADFVRRNIEKSKRPGHIEYLGT